MKPHFLYFTLLHSWDSKGLDTTGKPLSLRSQHQPCDTGVNTTRLSFIFCVYMNVAGMFVCSPLELEVVVNHMGAGNQAPVLLTKGHLCTLFSKYSPVGFICADMRMVFQALHL